METSKLAIEATRITATELARNLSDILSRARYRGERFVVERNGETVAVIEPPPEPKLLTLKEFLEEWAKMPKPDDGFWDDVEEGRRLMNQPIGDPWQP
jgi:antitoxin (DNA-binding transcriptional repressor) of toxin-antitoxin stability system